MSVDLICVDPQWNQTVWPLARDFIKAAMERGGLCSFAEVEADIYRGCVLLWLVWDDPSIIAAAVTSLNIIDGAKIGTVLAAGGHGLDKFGPLLSQLEQHFRDEGCIRSRICGRKGWARYYPEYKVKAVILERQL
jgi:hypothetical protein